MGSRKKKSATPSSPQYQPQQARAPWYKRTWVVIVAVASAAFTLGMNGPTLLQNIRKLPAEIETTRDQYVGWLKDDAEWAGDWSAFPEGNVDIADMRLTEGVDFKISLQTKNGEVGGMIASQQVCENLPFDFLMLRGTVSRNTANLEVWDIVGGHQRVFERIKLVREGHVMTVYPASATTSWFPSGARIGKHPETDAKFIDSFCKGKRRSKSAQ